MSSQFFSLFKKSEYKFQLKFEFLDNVRNGISILSYQIGTLHGQVYDSDS